ncbi:MAG: HEPN domain-containing protein [Lachnospiraceae bacterium]|jgi:uncharacterized protein (UPF0332 family)|nr:HEPN domain-containing protein [Lachnospiraceae bacterium]
MDSGLSMELARYRLAQAFDCLKAAENNIESNLYKDVLNRSYYCIFHSIRAVLALDLYDSKKHSGIISEFHRNYIKTGKFEKHFSAIIRQSFTMRNRGDYEDFYIVIKNDVVQQMRNASEFLTVVTAYIDKFEEKIIE